MNVGAEFLYIAYALAGVIYVLYGWNLAWRLRRSRRELSDLKARLETARQPGSPPA